MGIPDPLEDSQFYQGVVTRRLVAFCIDLLVVLLLWCIVLVVGLLVTVLTLGLATPLALAVFGAADFLYRWAMLAARSATLGMLATGIEVRDADGTRLNPIVAFLHVSGFYLSVFVTPLLVIGWFLMASTPHRRMLHDLVLGTVVINRPA
jgi:uncharacterized RDD family membrane protein YckC